MKHAYLIIAHNNFPLLERLVRFLDSENADFYIHIDAKVKDFDFGAFAAVPVRSKITFTERHNIRWGHFSMVEAELSLLRASVAEGYDYYHLLSGVDIPVKSREYIESYFEKAPEKNYVNFFHEVISKEDLWRVKFHYPCQRWNIRKPAVRRTLRNVTAGAQLVLGVDRTRKYGGTVFQKGTQWWSITHAFAAYILSREADVYRYFQDTYCPDELFVQTLMVNSPFADTLPENSFTNSQGSCLRYIDWKRGNPYTFTSKDYDELIKTPSNALFARKIAWGNGDDLAERIFAHFSEPDHGDCHG